MLPPTPNLSPWLMRSSQQAAPMQRRARGDAERSYTCMAMGYAWPWNSYGI
jgi:hypothetical protein